MRSAVGVRSRLTGLSEGALVRADRSAERLKVAHTASGEKELTAEGVREMWRAEDPKARRTHSQRAADALAEFILHPDKGKAAGIALVPVADYDTTRRELANARISDGTPLPASELVKLARLRVPTRSIVPAGISPPGCCWAGGCPGLRA